MILDPRTRETQSFSQFREDLIEAGAVLVRARHDEGRRLPLENL
jgi:hypothetical protein